ncbi:MAG: peptidylprolyl isomerase [Alphaproteobacteria bacterium HGW-Alphaproteobacteria-17]|nr:MAG: peptidylprolyl isomerase [Alphaproteobacteria bacterium HGW-Alphaproteobacteria-17]
MKHLLPAAAAASLALPVTAQEPAPIPSPGEIAAAAPASDWIAIAPSDLLVMDLSPDAKGKPRRVVIQLMPAPFSQGWIGNIRKLAAAHWWDGTSVNRVQDNYVVQWGDATEKKALPEGLVTVAESDYQVSEPAQLMPIIQKLYENKEQLKALVKQQRSAKPLVVYVPDMRTKVDPYAGFQGFANGWPLAGSNGVWPVHCYGMVGVGRNLSPDTGTGAELYTVIGHAPRHLDQNIALVGRVISGIEHLSSLPRGTGALGFYETEAERVPILSVRIATELVAAEQPRFEYLSTESDSFARYADARANRRDPFFIKPAGGADICNIPVPVRAAGEGK